jgi:hypothetical protein
MLLHSIVFASRCARVQTEFLAAEAEDEPADGRDVRNS